MAEDERPRRVSPRDHRYKTAALIVPGLQAGATLAGASPSSFRVRRIWEKIGLAFQMPMTFRRGGRIKKAGKRGSDAEDKN